MGCGFSTSYPDTTFVSNASFPSKIVAVHSSTEYNKHSIHKKFITKEMLTTYVDLSKLIGILESKNAPFKLQKLEKQHKLLTEKLSLMNEQLRSWESRLKKPLNLYSSEELEKKSLDITSEEITKIEEEFFEAKRSEKIAQINDIIATIQEKIKKCELMQEHFLEEQQKLFNSYDRQDEILEKIFGGVYGSEYEDQLEASLYNWMKTEQIVKSIFLQWKQCEKEVEIASQFLWQCCTIWYNEILLKSFERNVKDIFAQYNVLGAVARNLEDAFGRLVYVKIHLFGHAQTLPYFNKLRTDVSWSSVFLNPFASGYNQNQLYYHYCSMHKSSTLLKGYINQVIDNVITNELQRVQDVIHNFQRNLKHERVRLLKEMAKEHTGENFEELLESELSTECQNEIDNFFDDEALQDIFNVSDFKNSEDDGNALVAIEKTTAFMENKMIENEDIVNQIKQPDQVEETVILNQTAEQPTRNELFGDLDSLMAEHYAQMKNFQLVQDSAKARGDANLKERLKRRRSRKIRESQNLDNAVN